MVSEVAAHVAPFATAQGSDMAGMHMLGT